MDEYLKWNKTEFNEIQTIRLDSSRIWLPDTYIYNSKSKGGVNGDFVMVNYKKVSEFLHHKKCLITN